MSLFSLCLLASLPPCLSIPLFPSSLNHVVSTDSLFILLMISTFTARFRISSYSFFQEIPPSSHSPITCPIIIPSPSPSPSPIPSPIPIPIDPISQSHKKAMIQKSRTSTMAKYSSTAYKCLVTSILCNTMNWKWRLALTFRPRIIFSTFHPIPSHLTNNNENTNGKSPDLRSKHFGQGKERVQVH